MKDQEFQVLEQYDIDVDSTRKTRGAVLCETNKGLLLLQKLGTSQKRIPILEQIHAHLREQGYEHIDAMIRNRNDEIISEGEDGEHYILKQWYPGRECDIRREDEILLGIRNLATLHTMLCGVDAQAMPCEDLISIYRRRNREMKKVRAFVRATVSKGEFELLFLKNFDKMFDRAREITARLEASDYDRLLQESRERNTFVHGEYNYHNLLICSTGIATTNFEHFQQNLQVLDLYYFMRKTLEKNRWSQRIGYRMLEEYQKIMPLSEAEIKLLAICLAYPEKFWKVANSYYRSSKVWIPAKRVEKLETAISQMEEKKRFLKQIFAFHF